MLKPLGSSTIAGTQLVQPPGRPIARGALVCLFLVGVFGCSLRDDRGVAHPIPVATQHDSAGVHIVDYSLGQPRGHGAVVWALESTPEFQVNVMNGGRARPVSIARAELLGDGRLAVGVRERNEVYLYDSAGAYVRSIGRRGRGLGEFRSFAGPWGLLDDQIAAYDAAARRVSVFDTSGEVRRTTSYSALYSAHAAPYLEITGFVRGGAALGIVGSPPANRVGVTRPNIKLVLLDATGRGSKTLGSYLGREMRIGPSSNGFHPLGTTPFAFLTLAVAGNCVIALADNAAYEIRLMNSEGELKTIIRAGVKAERATDADFRVVAAEEVHRAGPNAPPTDQVVKMLRASSSHAEMPVLHALLLDHANGLWVEEFAGPGEKTRRVSVYSLAGLLRGAFDLPTSFDLLSADRDRLVVREHTGPRSGVVQLFRLKGLPPAPAMARKR
jgi:hypothetical protein